MKPEAENIQSLTKSVFPRVLLLSSQGLWKMVKIGVTEEKTWGSSGFLLVPAEMLSESQNSGKCLLLTMVSFKDGGVHFSGFVNYFCCC